MITPHGVNIFELDRLASTNDQPIGVIAADCWRPKEIDDAVYVQELPASQELYRVGVCVVDASKLYEDYRVLRDALTNTTAEYWDLPNGERGYKPMIDLRYIRRREFAAGYIRNALMVNFVIGPDQPMTDIEIKFGKVEVLQNMNFARFDKSCRYSDRFRKFGRAAAAIMQQLQYTSGGDEDTPLVGRSHEEIHHQLIHVPPHQRFIRGSKINEAFMVGAGSAVGRQFKEEKRLAINRVHDRTDTSFIEFLPPNIARFSTKPGRHDGLNIPEYVRVTSPLRRLEDFIMHRHLRLRAEGKNVSERDERILVGAVQRLNSRIVQEFFAGGVHLDKQNTLGLATAAERFHARFGGVVLPALSEELEDALAA